MLMEIFELSLHGKHCIVSEVIKVIKFTVMDGVWGKYIGTLLSFWGYVEINTFFPFPHNTNVTSQIKKQNILRFPCPDISWSILLCTKNLGFYSKVSK